MGLTIKSLAIFVTLFLSAYVLVVEGDANKMLELVNEERSKVDCHPLTLDERLMKTAQEQNDYCSSNNVLTHDNPAGDLGTRLTDAGYSWSTAGENVAEGFDSNDVVGVMNAWMNDPGHRANILNSGFYNLGVGCGGGFWTQDFGATFNSDTVPYNSDVQDPKKQPKKQPKAQPKKFKKVKFGKFGKPSKISCKKQSHRPSWNHGWK